MKPSSNAWFVEKQMINRTLTANLECSSLSYDELKLVQSYDLFCPEKGYEKLRPPCPNVMKSQWHHHYSCAIELKSFFIPKVWRRSVCAQMLRNTHTPRHWKHWASSTLDGSYTIFQKGSGKLWVSLEVEALAFRNFIWIWQKTRNKESKKCLTPCPSKNVNFAQNI